MQGISRIAFFLLFTLLVSMASAQRDVKDQAKKYFKAGKYAEALELYNQVEKVDKELLVYKGISAHHTGDIDKSLTYLIESYSMGNKDERLYAYMGDNYLAQGKYEEATRFYKSYLQYVDKGSAERNKTIHKIKRCGFAKDYKHIDQLAFVENLGEAVNTEFDELSPLQSPGNPNKYYFSSNRMGSSGGLRASDGTKDDIYGSYSADMYAIESRNGNWTPVSSINPILNGPKHDIIQDFGDGGKILYYIKFKNTAEGDLLTDTFQQNTEQIVFPSSMVSPIVSSLGDRDIRVFNQDTYLFSSKRAGGYGGYDLYIVKRDTGVWSEPINLGPRVNSSFDERTPFLSKSGSKLFFSSNRLNSMGGFDIYESDFGLETTTWSVPNNLGLPINSPADDLYFRLSNDGLTGIMSSDRTESIGGYDLFMIYFKNQIAEQMNLSYTIPFLELRAANMAAAEMAKEEKIEDVITEKSPLKEGPELAEITDDNLENPELVEEELEKIDYSGVETREVLIGPLYYQSSENIINPANLIQLNKVVETLKIFPETKVEITGHAIKEGLPEFDLYFSIKRSEKAADYIINRGVSSDRIYLRGVGSEYPVAKPTNAIQSNKLNRRLDIRVIYPDGVPLKVLYERIAITDAAKDTAIDKLKKSNKGLTYRIHIASTKQMYKDPIIRLERDIIIDKSVITNSYIYTQGLYKSYNEARNKKSRLNRDQKFAQVTVEPYIDGRLVERSQIESLKASHPDLSNYIRYELEK